MRDYRLYLLDKRNHIIKGVDFQAADDTGAVRAADLLCRTNHAIEIWDGKRCVARIGRQSDREAENITHENLAVLAPSQSWPAGQGDR